MTNLDLTTLTLASGAHSSPEQGLCLLEAVAYMQGEPFSDHPACVSPFLGAFGRSTNDALPDSLRQNLVPLVPLLPGTAGDGLDERRAYLTLDWLIRVYVPAHLDLHPDLREHAATLRGLPEIADSTTLEDSLTHLEASSGAAASVWASVRASVRDSVWDSVRASVWASVWDSVRDSVRASVRASVWDSVWDSVRASVWASVWDSVRASVWDSVWDSVWASVRASVWDSVRASVWASVRASVWAAAPEDASKWVSEVLDPLGLEMHAQHVALFERLATLGKAEGGTA